jgi:serine/threonine protein kinase/tetratricopeptide (TPR) repeat protein
MNQMAIELSNGTPLLHYRIISKIGAGGMGDVYLAEDTKLDRKVAIKFLRDDYSKDADKLGRFVREAKAASALNHPHILTVYEIGTVDDTNYIATEYIEGSTLRDILNKKEPLQLSHVLKIGVQVSEALGAAHAAGIVHRDIKPENIMIRRDGYAKVLDFGLAKLSEQKAPENVSAEGETRALVHTNPGTVMGTANYMSPEQARGKETDLRTDIWSLGAVLYEMLAGRVPFTGETGNHTIVAILEKEPLLLDNVPGELQRIVRKSLTKDTDMRYQSARDMLIDLKNLRRDLDIQGELERSIVPDRETHGVVSGDGATQFSYGRTGSTQSGQFPPTQGVTTSSSSLEYAVNQAKGHKLGLAVIGLVLVGLIGMVVYFGFIKPVGARQISSIAVMPFVNGTGDPDTEYLSDGMADSLIGSLSQIANLNVKARSSVFRYKGKDTDAKTIGKELGVQAILNGRVVEHGDQLVLNLELIDTSTENVLWAEQYDRRKTDLVTLQSEIARDVSQKLKTRLSSAEEQKVAKSYTADPEAYQLYLKGTYYWNKRTPESLTRSIEYFKQAIDKDPGYAQAFAGMALSYVLLPEYFAGETEDSVQKGTAAARHALELDGTLAEAHAALGLALQDGLKMTEATQELQRAIELNPNYATAHQWYGGQLTVMGKFDDGIAETRRALELDPLSLIVNENLAEFYYYSGDYDKGLEQEKATISLDPSFFLAHLGAGQNYEMKGMYPEALAEYKRLQELNDDPNYYLMALGHLYAVSGKRDGAVKVLGQMNEMSASRHIAGYNFALIYTALGDKDKAIEYLEKDFEAREAIFKYVAIDPMFKSLRSDPRFVDLLRRAGFPNDVSK